MANRRPTPLKDEPTVPLDDLQEQITKLINNNTIARTKLNPAPANIIKKRCHTFLACNFFSLGIFLSSSISSPAKDTYPPRGIALIEYSVSPFFLNQSLLPIPIENSYT